MPAIVGLDDTDSREAGMCTTYAATAVAGRLRERGHAVERLLLVRCNPAVVHKTRGNAALAIHTDADPGAALAAATATVEREARRGDDRTSPGVVVAPGEPDSVPEAVASFASRAVTDHHEIADAVALAERAGYDHRGWDGGRGRIGALAAVGAWRAFEEWTYERITYRERSAWGTDRTVDADSLFAAAADAYPRVWDSVDRGSGEVVCVPRTPCPVLYGIRGDDPDAVRAVAERIESEPVARTATFHTNQGTDAHLRAGRIGDLADRRGYAVDGTVAAHPETRRGGHVFVPLVDDGERLACAAYEPTKRFRDRVRALRPGDRVTVCGSVVDGTLNLEKFAVRELVRTERVTPTCPDCGRRMESAGAEQGYRCRDCPTTAPGTVERPLERALEVGWYEVPPRARRHVAKPLVRGGFDAPVHPER